MKSTTISANSVGSPQFSSQMFGVSSPAFRMPNIDAGADPDFHNIGHMQPGVSEFPGLVVPTGSQIAFHFGASGTGAGKSISGTGTSFMSMKQMMPTDSMLFPSMGNMKPGGHASSVIPNRMASFCINY